MKKIIVLITALLVVLMPVSVLAKSSKTKKTEIQPREATPVVINDKAPINMYLFRGEGCHYCEGFLSWWDSVDASYKVKVNLIDYEVWYDSENSALMQKVSKYFKDNASGVPYIIIGNKSFATGFDESMGPEVLAAIDKEYEAETRFDVMEELDKPVEKNDDKKVVIISIFAVLIVLGGAGLVFAMRKSEM